MSLYTYYDGPVRRAAGDQRTQVFVFGSNLAGRHGAGAAVTAVREWGAQMGKGIGLAGNSYALPTKDVVLKTLPLNQIKMHVKTFIDQARYHSDFLFHVTPIGTGYAGYSDSQIAPLFIGAPVNCWFPAQWRRWLEPRAVLGDDND